MSRIVQSWCLAALLALVACGNTDTGLPTFSGVWAAITASDTEPRINPEALRASLTPDVLSQTQSQLILVQVDSRDAVAVVSRVGSNGRVETYLTANGISFSLDAGLLVATRGLGFDLMTADVAETQIALQGKSPSAVRIHRYLDGENQVVAQSFVCTFSLLSPRTVQENCNSASQSFANSYTFNEVGRKVGSSQWISPQLGMIDIEVLN